MECPDCNSSSSGLDTWVSPNMVLGLLAESSSDARDRYCRVSRMNSSTAAPHLARGVHGGYIVGTAAVTVIRKKRERKATKARQQTTISVVSLFLPSDNANLHPPNVHPVRKSLFSSATCRSSEQNNPSSRRYSFVARMTTLNPTNRKS